MRVLLVLILLMILSPFNGTPKNGENSNASGVSNGEPSADLKVMFWWWTQPEWNAGIEMLNPPKKTVYSELIKWEYSDMEDSRYPHEVDLVATFKNSPSLGRGEVRFFAAGRYADLEDIQTYNEETDSVDFVPAQFEKLLWLNEKQVGREVVELASSGDEMTVSKELDLGELLNSTADGKQICGIRVRMEFVNADGVVTASNQSWFRVLLGD